MLLFNSTQNVSFKRISKVVTILALTLIGPILAGCSFQPLYGSNSHGENVNEALKAVQIPIIPGRVGQRVRNELIYQVTNGGSPLASKYRLNLILRESEIAALVTTSGDSQGQIYRLEAQFSLVRLSDNQVVFEGKSHSRAAYDKSFLDDAGNQVNSIFGNVRARIDAENRASRVIAEELKVRLATYLSTSA
ncbi:MAG: LPS assembly lipoprotein LptE [Pseudomonadota bacterium]